MTFRLPLLALAILALALAGCGSSTETTGGGNDAEPLTPTPLTKAALIAKADAICTTMQKKINAIAAPESIADLESAVGKQMKVSGPAIKQLQALVPPEELASKYDSWTSKLAQLQAGTGRVRDAAGSGSQAQVEKVISEVDKINTAADQIGTQIGFKVCSK